MAARVLEMMLTPPAYRRSQVCEEDQQTADPVQVVETIVDALDPSTSGAAGYCSYMCDGRQLAGCG
jgi:hypothetical protein